jgi:hypothetical protein
MSHVQTGTPCRTTAPVKLAAPAPVGGRGEDKVRFKFSTHPVQPSLSSKVMNIMIVKWLIIPCRNGELRMSDLAAAKV